MSDILYRREDAIGIVTLNRPERRNGLHLGMVRQLDKLVCEVTRNEQIAVVILCGAGEDFSVGADLKASADQIADASAEDLAEVNRTALHLHHLPQITIAMIDGGCAGAALGFALACDFRFASSGARFSTAFLDVALAGDLAVRLVSDPHLGTRPGPRVDVFSDQVFR